MGEVLCGRCELGYARVPRDGRCHACGCPITQASPEVSEAEFERARVAYRDALISSERGTHNDPLRAAITAARGGVMASQPDNAPP